MFMPTATKTEVVDGWPWGPRVRSAVAAFVADNERAA